MQPDASYAISAVTSDEAAAFVRTVGHAFGRTEDDDYVAHIVELELADPSLSLAARAEGRIIGTATALDVTMTLPAAPAARCAGVTSVTTAPTHRRRGVLSSLMRRQIDDLRARGWAWAALYASESAIYGRYGYGAGTSGYGGTIDRAWTRFATPSEPAVVDLLSADEALERVPPIYAAVAARVPGMMGVSDVMWRHRIAWDPPGARDGASGRFVVALGDRAYAMYRIRTDWSSAGPDATLRVEECLATDVEAHRQIWSYLFGIDLVQHITIGRLAADHPLPWWLAERQRLRLSPSMPLYVRLIDVGAALSQRGTRADTAVTLDVADGFCPWNARRWMLDGDGTSLQCVPAGGAAEVRLDSRELASMSLGGVTPRELAHAGLVHETTPGALARLEALLASDRAPFNAFTF